MKYQQRLRRKSSQTFLEPLKATIRQYVDMSVSNTTMEVGTMDVDPVQLCPEVDPQVKHESDCHSLRAQSSDELRSAVIPLTASMSSLRTGNKRSGRKISAPSCVGEIRAAMYNGHIPSSGERPLQEHTQERAFDSRHPTDGSTSRDFESSTSLQSRYLLSSSSTLSALNETTRESAKAIDSSQVAESAQEVEWTSLRDCAHNSMINIASISAADVDKEDMLSELTRQLEQTLEEATPDAMPEPTADASSSSTANNSTVDALLQDLSRGFLNKTSEQDLLEDLSRGFLNKTSEDDTLNESTGVNWSLMEVVNEAANKTIEALLEDLSKSSLSITNSPVIKRKEEDRGRTTEISQTDNKRKKETNKVRETQNKNNSTLQQTTHEGTNSGKEKQKQRKNTPNLQQTTNDRTDSGVRNSVIRPYCTDDGSTNGNSFAIIEDTVDFEEGISDVSSIRPPMRVVQLLPSPPIEVEHSASSSRRSLSTRSSPKIEHNVSTRKSFSHNRSSSTHNSCTSSSPRMSEANNNNNNNSAVSRRRTCSSSREFSEQPSSSSRSRNSTTGYSEKTQLNSSSISNDIRKLQKNAERKSLKTVSVRNRSKSRDRAEQKATKDKLSLSLLIKTALLNLVRVGEEIANEYPAVEKDMRKAYTSVQHNGNLFLLQTNNSCEMMTEDMRQEIVEVADDLFCSITTMLYVADQADGIKLKSCITKAYKELGHLKSNESISDLLDSFSRLGTDLLSVTSLAYDVEDVTSEHTSHQLEVACKALMQSGKRLKSAPSMQSFNNSLDLMTVKHEYFGTLSDVISTTELVSQLLQSEDQPYTRPISQRSNDASRSYVRPESRRRGCCLDQIYPFSVAIDRIERLTKSPAADDVTAQLIEKFTREVLLHAGHLSEEVFGARSSCRKYLHASCVNLLNIVECLMKQADMEMSLTCTHMATFDKSGDEVLLNKRAILAIQNPLLSRENAKKVFADLRRSVLDCLLDHLNTRFAGIEKLFPHGSMISTMDSQLIQSYCACVTEVMQLVTQVSSDLSGFLDAKMRINERMAAHLQRIVNFQKQLQPPPVHPLTSVHPQQRIESRIRKDVSMERGPRRDLSNTNTDADTEGSYWWDNANDLSTPNFTSQGMIVCNVMQRSQIKITYPIYEDQEFEDPIYEDIEYEDVHFQDVNSSMFSSVGGHDRMDMLALQSPLPPLPPPYSPGSHQPYSPGSQRKFNQSRADMEKVVLELQEDLVPELKRLIRAADGRSEGARLDVYDTCHVSSNDSLYKDDVISFKESNSNHDDDETLDLNFDDALQLKASTEPIKATTKKLPVVKLPSDYHKNHSMEEEGLFADDKEKGGISVEKNDFVEAIRMIYERIETICDRIMDEGQYQYSLQDEDFNYDF